MGKSREYYLRKAQEAQRRARAVDDPWLKARLEEITAGYRLLAEHHGGAQMEEHRRRAMEITDTALGPLPESIVLAYDRLVQAANGQPVDS
jgi:hypothetical protein